MNYPIIIAGAGIFFLVVATIWLIALNWSDKVYGPLLSLLFVGALTTFITVYLSLKESNDEVVFTTSVVMNTEDQLPFFIIPDPKNLKITKRFSNLSSLGRPARNNDGMKSIVIERPINYEETSKFCGELLQYKIIRDIYDLQKRKSGMSESIGENNRVIKTEVFVPYKLTETTIIDGKNIYQTISKNRFANSDMEQFDWENTSYPFPKNTSLEFDYVHSSESTGVMKHKILLKNPNFFNIEITIEPMISSGLPSLPEGLQLSMEEVQKSITYNFEITMKAKFEKWTSGNWRTDEYKEWAKRLFSGIRNNLSDTT